MELWALDKRSAIFRVFCHGEEQDLFDIYNQSNTRKSASEANSDTCKKKYLDW